MQAPGDKLWVYKHALYFLPLFLCRLFFEGQGVISLFLPAATGLSRRTRHLQFRRSAKASAVIAADAKPGQGFLFIY